MKQDSNNGQLKMKKNKQSIILTLIFLFIIANVSAQNSQLAIQLIDYNPDTQQSKIHIQNSAGFELTEPDLYINGIRTGRIAGNLADGKAVLYYQTITPGTYDITIKTKEGIEFTKQIEFGNIEQTQAETSRPKTASELVQDTEYQEFLEEQKKEQEIRRQRQQQELEKLQKAPEEKEVDTPKPIAEKPEYNPAIIILIIIFLVYIFLVINIFKRKKRK
jgi:uncharacterized integral membrane protein